MGTAGPLRREAVGRCGVRVAVMREGGRRVLFIAVLKLLMLLGAALGSARATVYFQEQFLDGGRARAGVKG